MTLTQMQSAIERHFAAGPGAIGDEAAMTTFLALRAALESGEVLTARGNFSVADNTTAKSILAQSPQAGSSFSDRVLFAVFLEEKGFKYDARRLWKELAKERPDDLVARDHSTR